MKTEAWELGRMCRRVMRCVELVVAEQQSKGGGAGGGGGGGRRRRVREARKETGAALGCATSATDRRMPPVQRGVGQYGPSLRRLERRS